MNKYLYDAKTNSFYPLALKSDYINSGLWPDTGVEIDENIFAEYQTPPPGKVMVAGDDGYPAWADFPLPDIEDVRRRKHDDINTWRNVQENANYTFTFNNHNWDYGKATQDRLSLSVQMAKQNRLPDGFIWTDADNNDVPMSAGELLNLSDAIDQAMFTKGLQIHMRQREMKEEIDKLTDVKAILDYKIDWPDTPTK